MAAAQPNPADKAAADSLFDEGKRLLGEQKFEEACVKFEESQRLDPGVGTLLYLGECYEKAGKTASAWTTFREAASAAHAAGQADREKTAKTRAETLDGKLLKLLISIPKENEVPGLEVKRNGVAISRGLWGVPFAVDPGKQKIDASAPGYAPWSKEVDGTSGVVTVLLPRLSLHAPAASSASSAAPVPSSTAAPVVVEPAKSSRKTIALVAGGLGLVGVAAGSYFGLQAFSRWDDSRGSCNDQNACNSSGKSLIQDARSSANLSTIFFAVGAAGLGAGAVLWFTAPSDNSSRVGLAASPNHVSLQGVW